MSKRANLQKMVPLFQTGLSTLVAGSVTPNTARLLHGCLIWARRNVATAATSGSLGVIEATIVFSTLNATTFSLGAGTFNVTSSNAGDVDIIRWFVCHSWGIDAQNSASGGNGP